MVFNDTTNDLGLIQDITFWTNASTNEFSLNDRTRSINEHSRRVLIEILQSQSYWDFDDSNYSDFPIITTSLVADQRDYSLPVTSEELIKIQRVEVSYDGTNWEKAVHIDDREKSIAVSNTDDLVGRFGYPTYEIRYGSIWLDPIPDTNRTSALKIFFQRDISPFSSSDTTKEPGFDAQFHRLLSIGASLDYCVKNQLPKKNDLKALYDELMERLKKHYSSKDIQARVAIKRMKQEYE